MSKRARNGNPRIGGQFVPVLHQMLDCAAWRALGPVAKLLYIALKRRARPENNGDVYLSLRTAAQEVGAHRNTVQAAFRDLQAKGFAEVKSLGRLGVEGVGKATTWILDELGTPGDPRPRKRYLAWSPGNDFPVTPGPKPAPKKQNPVTSIVQPCHNDCAVSAEPVTMVVPPCHNDCAVSGISPPDPVTSIVPHLESTMEGSGAVRTFAVLRRGVPIRFGVRVDRRPHIAELDR